MDSALSSPRMGTEKGTMLLGMIEEKYGAKLDSKLDKTKPVVIRPSLNGGSTGKNKRQALLSTLKKMVKFKQSVPIFPHNYENEFFPRNRKTPSRNGTDDEPGESILRTKRQWWEPPQDFLPFEFIQDTSLHGLKYIGQPKRHLSERIFWFVTFAIGLTVAVVLITDMWNKYKLNPVIVSFQPFETNVDQIPFPAVTVCNMNKVMKSKADDYISRALAGHKGARRNVYYMDHVCNSKSFAKRFNFEQAGELNDADRLKLNLTDPELATNLTRVNVFLRKAAQNCTDMIPLCVWRDREINCSEIFRPIETEFGKCCTFNMIPLSVLYTMRNDSRESAEEIKGWENWNIDQDGLLLPPSINDSYPKRQMKAGLTSGLSFALNAMEQEYYCTSSDSVGFRLAAHLPLEVPKIADFGISLKPRAEIFVDVSPQLTVADENIFGFDLNKRNCYKINEYKLQHYKYYSVNNCIEECIANATFAKCKCKRYFMPRTADEPLCGPQLADCVQDVRYNKTQLGIRNTCGMCHPSCTEVDYETGTTTTPIKSDIWKRAEGIHAGWESNNLSIVHVYIGQDSFYAKVRKELFGPTDLFANTGGLMGLCLGFSGLSLIELIYFLTLRAWWKHRRRGHLAEASTSVWATSRPNAIGQNQHLPVRSYYRSIFGDVRGDNDKAQ